MSQSLSTLLALISEGETPEAVRLSNDIMDRSRSTEERDHLIEARVRMERALLGAIGEENIGTELRWCVDRLNAICPGSPLHGLALLNLAIWHSNKGEQMMAMAVHSDISTNSGHPDDIRALSRLEIARILVGMGDLDPAMRHLWSARNGFIDSEMSPEALVTSLEWLNIALDDVSSNAPTMETRIEEASPREGPGNTWIPANPDDITNVVEYLLPILTADLSGHSRSDLGLIIDASEIIGRSDWTSGMADRISEIQDPMVLESLQS